MKRHVVEGGRPNTATCDICGEPLQRDKRTRNGWRHQRISRNTIDHDPENRGAIYRCQTCQNPIQKQDGEWTHTNPINNGHEAK